MTKELPYETARLASKYENALVRGESEGLPDRYQVFISYAREDSGWMDAIRQNLDQLPDFRIDSWVDKDSLFPGQNIDDKIKKGIESSNVALLLISAAFIDSEYIQKNELEWIKKRAAEGGLTITYAPISLPDGKHNAGIGDYLKRSQLAEILSSIPLDTPLASNPSQLEEALREGQGKQVVSGIRRAIDPHFSLLERNLDKKFVIQGRIAEGDSAIIYRARQESFRHEFAIKVLKEPQDLTWFQSALRNASSVTNTKNIVPIFDHRFRSSLSFCVLKYIEGETLSSYIQNNHPISVEFASEVIRKIGKALLQVRTEKAFRFVFFNIRPENILLEGDTHEPFLSLAVRPENRRGMAYIEELKQRGCRSAEEWAYLVPEFILPKSKETNPSITDQYLLGLIGYQMLTAKIPERIDRAELEYKELEIIQGLRKGSFDHIYPIIDKMLSVEPRDRFSDLEDAISAISHPEFHSLELVKNSYRRCAGSDAKCEKFFTDFYEAFLGKSDQALKLFEDHRFSVKEDSPIKKNQKWKKQRSILGHAVLLLLAFFEHQSRGELDEPTLLTFHRDRHRQPRLHPDKEAYQEFLEALLETVGKHDESWTKSETVGRYWKDLWRAVMNPGIEYMTNGAPRV